MEEAPRIERGERRSKEQDGMGTTVFAWNEVEARYALGRLRGVMKTFQVGREKDRRRIRRRGLFNASPACRSGRARTWKRIIRGTSEVDHVRVAELNWWLDMRNRGGGVK